MEIDHNYLRTGTAIGFRASRELFSNYLLYPPSVTYVVNFAEVMFSFHSVSHSVCAQRRDVTMAMTSIHCHPLTVSCKTVEH